MKTLIEKIIYSDSEAKKQAKALGLKYHGFGHWGTKDRVTHKTVRGQLIALSTSKTFDAPVKSEYDNSRYKSKFTQIPKSTPAGYIKIKGAEIKQSLTDEEHKEIIGYLYSSAALNGFLGDPQYRKTLLSFPDKIKELMKKTDVLDGIMKKSSLPEDVTLYRGIIGASSQQKMKEILENDSEFFSSPTFLSTSMSNSVAHGFEDYNNPMMLIIKAKKGTPALIISPDLIKIPSETKDTDKLYYEDVSKNEHEVILGRNLKFRLIRVERRQKPQKSKYIKEKEVIRIIAEIV